MTDDGTIDTSEGVTVERTQKSPSFGTQRGRSPGKKMLGPKQLIDENSSEGTDVDSEQVESQDLDNAESLAESLTSTSKVNVDVVNLCLHKIRLDTKRGQFLHTLNMLVLPLLPVIILLAQNINELVFIRSSQNSLAEVRSQIDSAIKISELVQLLQQERSAVAIYNFHSGTANVNNAKSLQKYVKNGVNISHYTMDAAFEATNRLLQNLDPNAWPKIKKIDTKGLYNVFKSKLSFQIRHSVFREKARDNLKSIFEVISWYDGINSFLMDYISFSIRDSDVGRLYGYIISLKNVLRSTEACGRAGVIGLRYLSRGSLSKSNFYRFVRSEMLRREYLNQTFQILPDLNSDYNDTVHDEAFESSQRQIFSLQGSELTDDENLEENNYSNDDRQYKDISFDLENDFDGSGDDEDNKIKNRNTIEIDLERRARQLSSQADNNVKQGNISNVEGVERTKVTLERSTIYFSQILLYSENSRKLVKRMIDDIEEFVRSETKMNTTSMYTPFGIISFLIILVPTVMWITVIANSSIYRLLDLLMKKAKKHKLLRRKRRVMFNVLIPRPIYQEMTEEKKLPPKTIPRAAVLAINVVNFTYLSADATPEELTSILNKLFETIEHRLENHNNLFTLKEKSDTILIAGQQGCVVEICGLSLDILAEIVVFEIRYKPGYHLKVRMGIHVGPCVAGLTGTVLPSYSLVGEAVENAKLMEATGEPMKIQMTESAVDEIENQQLEFGKNFDYVQREPPSHRYSGKTFWLIGRQTKDDLQEIETSAP